MSERGKKRSILSRVFSSGSRPEAANADVASKAQKTFTVPEKPVFKLSADVYDDVEEKAARWHALKREIAQSGERAKAKEEALKKLAEREVQDGVSLDADMTRLQDEIEQIRKAHERAQARVEPALRAAWTAALKARERVWAEVSEYEKKRDAYVRVLSEIMELVQEATRGVPTRHDLTLGELDRHHVEQKFGLPHVSHEFARGEPEREPPKPPTGAVQYVPAPVVTVVDAEPLRPIQPVTREDAERLREEAKQEHGGAGESDESADLLASLRSVLEDANDDADSR